MQQALHDKKYVDPDALGMLVQKYYYDSLSLELPGESEITAVQRAVMKREPLKTDKISDILQKLGHVHVLDISTEINLLREIKDIQDELEIMAMVFEDQARVLKAMENIVRLIEKASLSPKNTTTSRTLHMADSNEMLTDTTNRHETKPPKVPELNDTMSSAKGSTNTKAGWTEDLLPKEYPDHQSEEDLVDKNEGHISGKNVVGQDTIHVGGDQDVVLNSLAFRNRRQNTEDSQLSSDVWGSYHDPKHSSLPVSTIQLSVEKIKSMAQRAAKSNQAVRPRFSLFLSLSPENRIGNSLVDTRTCNSLISL